MKIYCHTNSYLNTVVIGNNRAEFMISKGITFITASSIYYLFVILKYFNIFKIAKNSK